MEPQEYRKLDVDLPRQPLSEQRWWLLAGLMLAFVILALTVYQFIKHTNTPVSKEQQRQHGFESW